MAISDLIARAEHFETLASRAAYQAATSASPADCEHWQARAESYDSRAADYRQAVRRAA